MVTVRHMEKPAIDTYVTVDTYTYELVMYYVLVAGWKEFRQLKS